jgi:uncharacterized protein (DUF1800 family)
MALETDREKCAHLLRRFGLGASEAELEFYLRDGLLGAVDRLVEYDTRPEGFESQPWQMIGQKDKPVPPQFMPGWWVARLVVTQRPLQEKLTLFWHDHFATSGEKVKNSYALLQQNNTLREHAKGNFRVMLKQISRDPAMLAWLDNKDNVKGKPNENFAREVMELFTLGIGHYTERDIQEAARAFTGWTGLPPRYKAYEPNEVPRGSFIVRPRLHDAGTKTIFGKTGNFGGDDVLDMLCDMHQTSIYITTKFLSWFVYPNPEPAYVERMAKVFRDSQLDIETLVKAVMRSSEFYSPKAYRAVVKSPVDYVVPTYRQMGIGQVVADALQAEGLGRRYLDRVRDANIAMKNMGQHLFYPPDVAGWDGGTAWITTATMTERIAWADRVFGVKNGRRTGAAIPWEGLFADDPTPRGVVDRLSTILDAPMSADRRRIAEEAAAKALGRGLNAQNAPVVGASVARMLFATPEFQFA